MIGQNLEATHAVKARAERHDDTGPRHKDAWPELHLRGLCSTKSAGSPFLSNCGPAARRRKAVAFRANADFAGFRSEAATLGRGERGGFLPLTRAKTQALAWVSE